MHQPRNILKRLRRSGVLALGVVAYAALAWLGTATFDFVPPWWVAIVTSPLTALWGLLIVVLTAMLLAIIGACLYGFYRLARYGIRWAWTE